MATEEYSVGYEAGYQEGWNKAIDSMAQPAQEPVAHVYLFDHEGRPRIAWDNAKGIKIGDKLYTAPPQRTWVGLNEKERNDIEDDFYANISIHVFDAIEAKLKEKNT